jgi:uncharacterized protein
VSEPTTTPDRASIANSFGLIEALIGLLVGLVAESLLIAVYDAASGHPNDTTSLGPLCFGLIGLWIGFVGSGVVATRRHARAAGYTGGTIKRLSQGLGFRIRPIDLPIGIAAGLISQYLLVPVLSAPLLPFVPNLYHRLGTPARTLTDHAQGPGLAVLGVFICLGSPICEELYFRGLIFRGFLGAARKHHTPLPVVGPIILTGLLFGLAHFEALQFLGLAGFGIVCCVLAYRTGRLGPSIVAHVTFNTVTFVALATSR